LVEIIIVCPALEIGSHSKIPWRIAIMIYSIII